MYAGTGAIQVGFLLKLLRNDKYYNTSSKMIWWRQLGIKADIACSLGNKYIYCKGIPTV
jgi:hypothetical protein